MATGRGSVYPPDVLALPIDDVLPDVTRILRESSAVVVEAPPGAGKTTRLPWALVGESWCTGQVLVAEPRRIAARVAAGRVAEERGTKLGEEVGYRVRFEDVSSPKTRVLYQTSGVLLRSLLDDPQLRHASAVVLDEVHERSRDIDLALALIERLRRTERPDLRLLVMSATLDGGTFAAFLGDCPRVRSEGRTYDVRIDYLSKPDERPLERQVRSAVRSARQREGSMLVFLPGAGEIRRCQEALREADDLNDLDVMPLHGDLSIAEQAHAVAPSTGRPRVVLSTNVAESSVTIADVTTVIDTGLSRVARHSPWSGVSSLELEEISRARAVQRSGRAGRVRDGVALRLYTKGNFLARPEHDAPEIERDELGEVVLMLAELGLGSSSLNWLSPPPEASWNAASELLRQLGALESGKLTPLGRHLAALPLAPRLGRIVLEGSRLDCLEDACWAAALLSERDVLRTHRASFSAGRGSAAHSLESGDCDVTERIDRLLDAQDENFDRRVLHSLDLDPSTTRRVARGMKQLKRAAERLSLSPEDPGVALERTQRIARCLLAGFPDRVASRRGDGDSLLLCGGTSARLSDQSVVHRAPLMVAVAADRPRGRRNEPLVRLASRVEPSWLLEGSSDWLDLREEFNYDGERERVDQVDLIAYGKIVLDETRRRAEPGPEAGRLLAKAARAKGPAVYDPTGSVSRLLVRLGLLRDQASLQELAELPRDLETFALETACAGSTSMAELRAQPLAELIEPLLPSAVGRALREETPEQLTLPSGRRLPIHYEPDRPPWIQSRLQDFFSMTATPTICRGRVSLQVRLLAPNQRPVQVTTDLAGFWERHYPDLRKQLMRRYPKHAWPEDGRNAEPPALRLFSGGRPRPPRRSK